MASTTIGDKTITAYLRKIIGFPVGQIIPLTNSDISIGSTKTSDICINNANISSRHCTLNYSTDGWFLTDLGGVNGTFIDSNKLMPQIPHPLKDGINIYLGPPSDSPVAFVFIKNERRVRFYNLMNKSNVGIISHGMVPGPPPHVFHKETDNGREDSEVSTSKKGPQVNIRDMLEEEFICNICTEVFIKTTTLGCSHTFCEHCITKWIRKQRRCPMCREMITSGTRILIVDNFIDGVVEKLDKAYQDKRKEVIASREAAKVNAKIKKKRKKSFHSHASRRSLTPPILVRRDNQEDMRQWREMLETSSGSNGASFEYCLFCGDPGHNTNDCP